MGGHVKLEKKREQKAERKGMKIKASAYRVKLGATEEQAAAKQHVRF